LFASLISPRPEKVGTAGSWKMGKWEIGNIPLTGTEKFINGKRRFNAQYSNIPLFHVCGKNTKPQ
jgi:hypothetical protein